MRVVATSAPRGAPVPRGSVGGARRRNRTGPCNSNANVMNAPTNAGVGPAHRNGAFGGQSRLSSRARGALANRGESRLLPHDGCCLLLRSVLGGFVRLHRCVARLLGGFLARV